MKTTAKFIEAAKTDLVVIGRYRQIDREVKLRADAADVWRLLAADASADGVKLVPISGFRTVAYQEMLFQTAIAKHGSEEVAAHWVARPGFSEHHTGLALDIGDEEHPACDVELPFEKTRAFSWLKENAGGFGFELSFPCGNSKGINYEPWHWRYVGSPEAKEVFAP